MDEMLLTDERKLCLIDLVLERLDMLKIELWDRPEALCRLVFNSTLQGIWQL